MIKKLLSGKRIKVFMHILAWIIILGLPLYIVKQWNTGKDFLWFYYTGNIVNGIIFYLNYLVLVPLYFFERRRRYLLMVISVLVILYFASAVAGELVNNHIGNKRQETASLRENFDNGRQIRRSGSGFLVPRPPFRQIHLYNYAVTSIFLVFFSTGLRVLERQDKIEKYQRELEKEKLNSELAFLKNQISPHFLFNTLNNIYSLIDINAADSQKAVLKLSKLMRYLLYDTEKGNTSLGNEIEFMNNYIDLMRLRMSDKIKLSVIFPLQFDDVEIPPLLFIPYIENAFKHGVSYKSNSFIDIKLDSSEGSINFSCVNTIANTSGDITASGIGLENAGKRLNLLFPGKHNIDIDSSDGVFSVKLNIDLA
jgi:sensor histidine kinase YesM